MDSNPLLLFPNCVIDDCNMLWTFLSNAKWLDGTSIEIVTIRAPILLLDYYRF